MRQMTELLWADQNRHTGDRQRLFAAIAAEFPIRSVLYPGSFVDVAPSFVFASVVYVDNDRRAAQFFDDQDGVAELIAGSRPDPGATTWRFLPVDYRSPLEVAEGQFDLLISLYAGFVSEHCTQYLRPGGILLVNSSHGDAAMASIDPRYELAAVVTSRSGSYTVRSDELATYLQPKKPIDVTPQLLHWRGRGIAYTRAAFAYMFRRIR